MIIVLITSSLWNHLLKMQLKYQKRRFKNSLIISKGNKLKGIVYDGDIRELY